MTSLKLALVSLASASALLACSAASSTDEEVGVDVEASQLQTKACPKGGCPPPPPSTTSTCVAPSGGPTRVLFAGSMINDLEVSPISSSSGGVKTGGGRLSGAAFTVATGDLQATASPSTSSTATGNWTAVAGDFQSSSGLVFEASPGQGYSCEGTTPEGLTRYIAEDPKGSGIYKCFAGCMDTSHGIPHGFTAINVYVCPPLYPVNRCTPWNNSCTCTSS